MLVVNVSLNLRLCMDEVTSLKAELILKCTAFSNTTQELLKAPLVAADEKGMHILFIYT